MTDQDSKSYSAEKAYGPKTVINRNDQLNVFNEIAKTVLLSYGLEVSKVHGFISRFENRYMSQGDAFLKEARNLFIQGIRVLGDQEPAFSSYWSLNKLGYPKGWSFIFEDLSHLGMQIRLDEQVDYSLRQVRLLLSVLRLPMAFGSQTPSTQKVNDVLTKFCEKISTPDSYYRSDTASVTGMYLAARVSKKLPVEAFTDSSLEVNLTLSTNKSRGPDGPPTLPRRLLYIDDSPFNETFVYGGPAGKVTYLPERGGKFRIITSYDGQINGNTIRERCLIALDKFPGDYSRDQSSGQEAVRLMTLRRSRSGEDIYLHSTDLSSFTDNFLPSSFESLLRVLNASDFRLLWEAPIEGPGGRVYQPNRLLMGLRGTFELATLLHNCVAEYVSDIQTYAMCGDDLVLQDVWDEESPYPPRDCCPAYDPFPQLSEYQVVCGKLGLELNLSKCVTSRDTAIFCGKVFINGHDVSPVTFNFSDLAAPENPSWAIDAYASVIDRLKKSPWPRKSMRAVFGILVKLIGRLKFFRGLPLPKHVPFKLGGLGLPGGPGLIASLTDSVINALYCVVGVIDDSDDQLYARRSNFIPYDPPGPTTPPFPFLESMGIGHVHRYKKPKRIRPPRKRGTYIVDLLNLLEYYYSIGVYANA